MGNCGNLVCRPPIVKITPFRICYHRNLVIMLRKLEVDSVASDSATSDPNSDSDD